MPPYNSESYFEPSGNLTTVTDGAAPINIPQAGGNNQLLALLGGGMAFQQKMAQERLRMMQEQHRMNQLQQKMMAQQQRMGQHEARQNKQSALQEQFNNKAMLSLTEGVRNSPYRPMGMGSDSFHVMELQRTQNENDRRRNALLGLPQMEGMEATIQNPTGQKAQPRQEEEQPEAPEQDANAQWYAMPEYLRRQRMEKDLYGDKK